MAEVDYHPTDAIFPIIIALLLGVVTNTISSNVPRRWSWLPIPYTGWMLLYGIGVGLTLQAGGIR
jgi:hypothetical protein